jgi:hypothetical protein
MNSSFQISRSGARAAVLKAIAADRAKPDGTDQAQIESAKALIAAEIGRLPKEFNGVQVIAGGDTQDGRSTTQLQVFGTKLDL